MNARRRLAAPFGERARPPRKDGALMSRGLVVETGPQHRARQALRAAEQLSRAVVAGPGVGGEIQSLGHGSYLMTIRLRERNIRTPLRSRSTRLKRAWP